MDISIFTDKKSKPDDGKLKTALGGTYELWKKLEDYVIEAYPAAVKEWNFSGEKYGWSYRLKDRKRAIIYFLPRGGFFKAAFVFGEKAYFEILNCTVNKKIKDDLKAARPYAEGRGIRIDVNSESGLNDIFKLVNIKLSN